MIRFLFVSQKISLADNDKAIVLTQRVQPLSLLSLLYEKAIAYFYSIERFHCNYSKN